MRKLKTSDVFKAIRIIKKTNLKERLKPYLLLAAEEDLSITEIGIEGVLGLLEILSEENAEDALYEVLSGPFEMTVEEVGNLEVARLIGLCQTLAKENNLKVFMKSVSGLISKQ